jgi:hypothetical protein
MFPAALSSVPGIREHSSIIQEAVNILNHSVAMFVQVRLYIPCGKKPACSNFSEKNRRRYTLAEAARLLSQVTSFQWSEDDATKAIKQLLRYMFLKTIKNPLWKNKLTISKNVQSVCK